jgi:RNA polymerase sigma factor (sigma-70 family)
MDWDRQTDAQLLVAARADAESFRVLYDRYAERAFAFFQRRTGNREASLDLTAETFARAWLGRDRFRDLAGGSAGPWLFAIARRVLIASVELRRLESDARERLGLLAERSTVDVEPEPAWLEELTDALDSLPRSQRRAVELRVVHDLSYDELAAGVRCSPTAARIRVSRGLSALRAALGGGAQ